MRYCISFAGAGERYEVAYRYMDMVSRTSVIQEALVDFFHPDTVFLLATARSQKETVPGIRSRVACCTVVPIPDGKTTEELWEIFRVISQLVQGGDTIIFDLTHGFRTLPFISFLAVTYLQEIRKAVVERVVYGAVSGDKKSADIIDVTGFTRILDWMMAVHSFLAYSEGRDLSSLLNDIQREFHVYVVVQSPKRLKGFGAMIENYSTAMQLARPVDVSAMSREILEDLPGVAQEAAIFAPPLDSILGQVSVVQQFQTSQDAEISIELLEQQLRMIRTLIGKNLILQAISLSREWIVNYSYLVSGLPERDWLEKKSRSSVEHALTYEAERRKKNPNPRIKPNEVTPIMELFPGIDALVKLWSKTSIKRNDLAHCGMNPDGRSMGSVHSDAERVISDIEGFYRDNPPTFSNRSEGEYLNVMG
ncbi:MAG: TIGR02221 family CRISPR-associated protein [Methanospirillum sp.]|nr:TIGR02221 family CRISPR-associated protein [Methanospirillum sp.]